MKQIPRRIRDIRREYSFLTKELLKRGINYRWLIPEGLLFTWQEQRHRIETLDKAELFVMEYFRGKEEEKRSKDQELIDLQEKELMQMLEKGEGAVGGAPREQ
uniref:Uncharacterized protein n=1 Tax=Micrurus lemniscatus lemniscatus TaxID=129467 RepID=A0A2D4ID63_MICLE